MRAGIYARISDDREDTNLGVQRQIVDCAALAQHRGWAITERYIDNDISAYKKKRRPAWEQMLADITARKIDAVIVWHLDRLTRQPRDLERFFDVCDQAGLRAMATVGGDIDLSTDDGRFHARILGAVARKSSDDASRRIKRQALDVARAGRSSGGGTRPFGFENDRKTIRLAEAKIIREITERALSGETLRGLCADLADRGITTPAGKTWRSGPLRRMLMSARISGQREHHGEIVAKAQWPAIITPEQTTQLRAIFTDPARKAARPARAYLLKGLVRCGECGAALVARPREDGKRRYVCATGPGFLGCGHCYVLAEPLEEFVTETILYALDTPQLGDALAGRVRNDIAAAGWQQEIETLTDRADELAAMYAAGAVSMREWLAARDPLHARIDELRRTAASNANDRALRQVVGRGGELRERWPSMSIDQRRAVITAVLSHVVVRRGRRGFNRFDPSRFELVEHHAAS